MFKTDVYIPKLIELLKGIYRERLLYVGLQGSYLRGEATEHSDIDIKNWNPLEICHLLHTTKDYYGTLAQLVPEYTKNDVRNFVKMSLGNLYHEVIHFSIIDVRISKNRKLLFPHFHYIPIPISPQQTVPRFQTAHTY